MREGGLTVRAPAGLEGPARAAAKIASRALPRIAGRLQLPVPKEITIILARGGRQVPPDLEAAMPAWAAGVAFPFRGVLVVRLDRLSSFSPGGTLRVVLEHELVHLVMGEAGRETFRKLPWWFHEGTAQVLSGLPFFAQEADLGALVQGNRLPLLKDLGRGESPSRRATDLAYQEAFSFCSFLEDRLGDDVFARVVRAQERAPDFDKAFLSATGFSYISLEAHWRSVLLAEPWATIQLIAGNFFLILLALSLPLVGLALMRRFKRDEEIERAWEEEGAHGEEEEEKSWDNGGPPWDSFPPPGDLEDPEDEEP